MCEEEDLEWTREAFHEEQRPHNTPVSSITTLLAGGRSSHQKVQSWTETQLLNDLEQGQLTVVQAKSNQSVTWGISVLPEQQSSHATYCAGQDQSPL